MLLDTDDTHCITMILEFTSIHPSKNFSNLVGLLAAILLLENFVSGSYLHYRRDTFLAVYT